MTTLRRPIPALLGTGLAILATALAPGLLTGQETADLLLHHGKLFTADATTSVHEAVVIRGEEIVAVGGNELIERFDARRELDLRFEREPAATAAGR